MPLPLYHMGPGILAKALLRSYFSLVVFGWTQILMDIQPLVAILSGSGEHHGMIHTLVGATVLGAGAAVTGKYIVDAGSDLLPERWRPRDRMPWRVAFLSALTGSYTHVALDAFAHPDVMPWWPFSESNQLYGHVSDGALLTFCVLSGVIGTVLYVTVSYARARPRKRVRRSADD